MSERVVVLAALTLSAVVGCSPSVGDDAASRAGVGSSTEADAAVDSAMERYTAAVVRGDTAAIAAVLTEDVRLVFPTGPMLEGRANVMDAFGEMFTSTSITELRPMDAQRTFSNDLAVEMGAFSITTQPRHASGTGGTTDRGYYMLVWERQGDGSWKMARGINRADTPPPVSALALHGTLRVVNRVSQ